MVHQAPSQHITETRSHRVQSDSFSSRDAHSIKTHDIKSREVLSRNLMSRGKHDSKPLDVMSRGGKYGSRDKINSREMDLEDFQDSPRSLHRSSSVYLERHASRNGDRAVSVLRVGNVILVHFYLGIDHMLCQHSRGIRCFQNQHGIEVWCNQILADVVLCEWHLIQYNKTMILFISETMLSIIYTLLVEKALVQKEITILWNIMAGKNANIFGKIWRILRSVYSIESP